MTEAAALALIQAALQGLPAAIAAVAEITSLGKSGQKPTDEQWASWNAAADSAADAVDQADDQLKG
jgi:hypothetical protein